MEQTTVVISDPVGLHLQPATRLAKTLRRYQAIVKVYLVEKNKQAEAGSLPQLLKLGARQGDTLTLVAEGVEAREALAAAVAIIQGQSITG